MKENFLHYIWEQHLQLNVDYTTVEGVEFSVLDKGVKNTDAGADISQVRMKMGDVEWCGNVEIHVKASDWGRHKHNEDVAYNNVLLHFVAEKDSDAYTQDGRVLPTFVFPDLQKYFLIFERTFSQNQFIYCEPYFSDVSAFKKEMWLQRLVLERLQQKTQAVYQLLEFNKNSWEETCYQLLARYFGQKLNGDAFEQLARSLPLRILVKHKDSLFQIEALLFGQAGMLQKEDIADAYYQNLQKEYRFLQQKYELESMNAAQWKFLRLRPANFPTLRIAQLATLIHKSSSLFSRLLEADTCLELYDLFAFSASEYWHSHYVFAKQSAKHSIRKIGKSLKDLLVINVVVPLLFAYANYAGDAKRKEKALAFLEEIDAEHNYIITAFEQLGMLADTAYFSQGMLQLNKKYCTFRRCEQCLIGHEIFKQKLTELP